MNKIYIAITAVLITIPSAQVLAADATNDVVPPVQTQKDQVPNSTENGNYLEPQPDNNGATSTTKDKHGQKHKAKSSTSKPGNLEKSKNVTEDPASGGVEVKPK